MRWAPSLLFGLVLATTMAFLYAAISAVGWRSPPDCWVLYTLLPSLVVLVSLGPLYGARPPQRHGDDEGGDTT